MEFRKMKKVIKTFVQCVLVTFSEHPCGINHVTRIMLYSERLVHRLRKMSVTAMHYTQ